MKAQVYLYRRYKQAVKKVARVVWRTGNMPDEFWVKNTRG